MVTLNLKLFTKIIEFLKFVSMCGLENLKSSSNTHLEGDLHSYELVKEDLRLKHIWKKSCGHVNVQSNAMLLPYNNLSQTVGWLTESYFDAFLA